MNLAKRISISFCSLAVMLAFLTGIAAMTASAAAHGIYTAAAHPYYIHPVTGVVEDAGNNPVIGQAMTESVLYKTALIEVDKEGKTYVTFRFSLMDNIRDFAFQVQKDGNSPFQDVEATIMKEDLGNNKTDFRLELPSEKAIVRSSFYVIAMGRDVVFYMNFSDLKEGSGDFITSVTVDQSGASSPSGNSSAAVSGPAGPASTPESPASGSPQSEAASDASPDTNSSASFSAGLEEPLPQVSTPEYVKEDGLLIVQVNHTDAAEKKPPLNPVAFLIGGAAIAAAVTGSILFRKVRRNRR